MKNKYLFLGLISFLLVSCNNGFLDRAPLSEISPKNGFSTAKDLELYTNDFYRSLPSWGEIKGDRKTDNILYSGIPVEQRSGQRIVPASAGSGGWSWGTLRKINIFLKYYKNCDDKSARKKYSGIARFFRAYFYFKKVKRFGGVPWYNNVIGTDDVDDLQKERDSRTFVMSKILEDVNYAIKNLNSKESLTEVTKWTALALKSRICLYAGTYRKYHTELNLSGIDSLLNMSYKAAEKIMTESGYKVYSTGHPDIDYRDLFASDNAKENSIILARKYSDDLNVTSSLNYYLTSKTQDDISLTKNLVNSYLMDDGTRFTDVTGHNTMQFDAECKNRDPRLYQTIRTPGYHRIGNTKELVPDFGAAMSGYQIIKFLGKESEDGFEASYQDIPIFRYGEVLLNYAEAKAELGKLTQDDIDKSIYLLRKRVGMPDLDMGDANSHPDSYLETRYPNVTGANKGVILEIRRERRVELVMENFRWDDLMRWKAGELLEKHFEGMYFPSLGEFDLDGDGTMDVVLYKKGQTVVSNAPQKIEIGGVLSLTGGNSGNLIGFENQSKEFNEERDYLYPIPTGDILLNPNLEQNPKW